MFLKNLTLVSSILLLFPAILQAEKTPYIISGFDDVLRQANNTNLFNVTVKIFEKDKTYTGMPELYRLISKNEDHPKFSLVSAISSMFENRIDRFLKKATYPSNKRHLRNWLTEWSITDFKMSNVREIINEHPGKKFIVIFDNSNASLNLAKMLQLEFPNKILSIYLRVVVSKDLPSGTAPFFTAFDIAVNELKFKRMDLKETELVVKSILKESNLERLLPSYGLCPIDYDPCNGIETALSTTCNKVKNHVRKLCSQRSY